MNSEMWTARAAPLVPLGHGGELLEARFVERPNQFVLVVELEGRRERAAMADRGRLLELLVPGRAILIEARDGPKRKTKFQALAARRADGRLASLDTTLPNRLVGAALAAGALDEFGPIRSWRAEVAYDRSRFDFRLEPAAGAPIWLEVKSAGDVRPDGLALFPDAPSARGAHHARTLAAIASEARARAAILFVAQGDATRVRPRAELDPGFAAALAEARAAGVEVRARSCPIGREGIRWGAPIPVETPDV